MGLKANTLMFANSEAVKQAMTKQASIDVQKLYSKCAYDISEMSKFYATKQNVSAPMQVRYYNQLEGQVKASLHEVANDTYKVARNSAYVVSNAVVQDSVNFAASLGFDQKGVAIAMSSVPENIVKSITTGSVYDSGWSLSKAIWSDNEKTLKDVYSIVAQGRVKQESVYETAQKLEQYVNPSKALSWNLTMEDGVKIYKKNIDYNAQRLVRTLNQHAYQQSIVESSKNNPFIDKIKWVANGSRACGLCIDRDGVLYDKDKLPLDHPNGMCEMVPMVDEDINKKIADWVNAKDGEYPEIDEYAKQFGYNAKSSAAGSQNTLNGFMKKYGDTNYKYYGSWYKNLDNAGKVAYDKIVASSGKDAKTYFKDNILKTASSVANSNASKSVSKAVKAVSGAASKELKSDSKLWWSAMKKQDEAKTFAEEKVLNKSVSESVNKSIRNYSGSGYTIMNEYRRKVNGGMNSSQAVYKMGMLLEEKKEADAIHDYLASISTKEDIVLRRGTSKNEIAGLFLKDVEFTEAKRQVRAMTAEELSEKFAGAVGKYENFVSTSSVYDKGFYKDVEIILYAPKGTHGRSIMSLSGFGTGEGEFLLADNTVVRCIGIEDATAIREAEGASIRMYLEIIP